NGWAMEARLYAEDPARGFLPVVGRINRFDVHSSGWVRIETGVGAGDEVSSFYDRMIAKIIGIGTDRDDARPAPRAEPTLATTYPLRNNAAFLYRIAEHPAFAEGAVHTGFIADHLEELIGAEGPDQALIDAAATALAARAVPANAVDAVYGGPGLAHPWSSAV